MRIHTHKEHSKKALLRASAGIAVAWSLAMAPALAASTDISTAPLFTSSPTAVKPNIMFILDDSGSMASDNMPDDAPSSVGEYGYKAAQCNGLAFNPNTTYVLPINSDGSSKAAGTFPTLAGLPSQTSVSPSSVSYVSNGSTTVTLISGNSTFSNGQNVTLYDTASSDAKWMTGTAVWNNIAKTLQIKVSASSGSGTLSNLKLALGTPSFYYTYSGSQSPMSYTFNGTGPDKTTTFYKECTSSVGATPGSAVFTQVNITSASTGAQNYANWYTYYSTRMLMMKASVGLAFKDIDTKYRVGFTKISDKTVTSASFINPSDFDATQRTSFYNALYASTPGSNTPLRGALSKVGRYFAKKAPSQTVDPIQYSCQKNFTILSTDGYWNTGTENATYKSLKLDGVTLVGEQDNTAARPMQDGGNTRVTTVDTWTVSTPTSDQIVQQPKKTETITTQTAALVATPFQSTTTKTNALAATQTGSVITNSTITHSNKTVTVTTSSANGLAVGDKVVVAGVVSSGTNSYNGTFTVVSIVSTSKYTYTAGSTPSNNPTGFGTTTLPLCHGTQKDYTQTTSAVDNTHVNKVTTYSLKTDLFTTQAETLIQTVTNHSRTTVTLNGAPLSDTGDVVGTSNTSTTNPVLPNINVSTSTATGLINTVAQADSTANPSGPTTADLGCFASLPANPANTIGAPSTVVPVSTSTTASLTSPGTSNTSAAVTVAGTTAVSQSVTTTNTTTSVTNGSSDSLADIAYYYYMTDLRDESLGNCTGALGSGTDVCVNNVTGSGRDTANTQHMTTFTLGLAAGSTLKYDPNYLTQTSGDFFQIVNGTKDWPTPTVSSQGGDPTNVDDLWHAAVDGRGQYFSATDPTSLGNSLGIALNAIKTISGSAAAAATSSLQLVEGNNQLFLPTFKSVEWTGDVLALTVDPTTGAVSDTTKPTWSAQAKLDAMVGAGTARTIYYFKKDAAANTGALRGFTYANLSSDSLNSYFDSFCTKTGLASANPQQCSTLSSADLTTANTGSNLVSYLAGTRFTGVYRDRNSVLGDIINGSPTYLGAPPFLYTENGYASFASGHSGRDGVVYVPANDGMLHAFDGKTGVEKWAYIPSMVIPNLYKLADAAYPNNHQSFVDGSPTIGDIYVNGAWKSILVAGLSAGGRGYYALDITDPNNPVALWEFTDTDLGLTFGNPIITKLGNGSWVVVFSSGYNNNVSGGDGNGHLYVLDANTGVLKKSADGTALKLATSPGGAPVGSVGTPSGLAKINAWVDSPIDNTAKRFYGGDLLGNVWRFVVDASPSPTTTLLASLKVGSTPQPITTKVELAEFPANGANRDVVYVATGEYLGTSDLSNTTQQSIYAIKDDQSGTSLGDIRASGTLVSQTLTESLNANNQKIRTASSNAVDWSQKNGWMLDLPTAGERVNVDMQLQFNTLVVGSNIPNNDACTVGGESWLFQLSLGNGSNVSSAADHAAAVWEGTSMIVGISIAQLQSKGGGSLSGGVGFVTNNKGDITPTPVGGGSSGGGPTRRTSWRELAN